MKKPLDFNIPRELVSRISNYIHEDMTVEELVQDLLTIELSNGVLIDVGWFPENDLSGGFIVRVFGIDWSAQVAPDLPAADIQDLRDLVLQLANRFGRSSAVAISDSSDTPSSHYTSA